MDKNQICGTKETTEEGSESKRKRTSLSSSTRVRYALAAGDVRYVRETTQAYLKGYKTRCNEQSRKHHASENVSAEITTWDWSLQNVFYCSW
ncbi:hypothetical protein Bca52824_019876 [Brassica carinata]|uniref:Uncharacterized protein n=1 Tax=Brassica carinata TaxID=52824 RepID=A0A8X7VS81_BRACI|nr:hypothetical protein Bca52824_019876 [Brassica carinata]